MHGHSPLDVDRLLAESFIAHVEHHPTLASTNDRARALANEAPPLPVLVVADEQTAGRGRGTNTWWTGRDNLAMTVLLDPAAMGIGPELVPRISLAAGVAVVETVRPWMPEVDVGLHWPNDVFAGEHKLGGILAEGLSDGRLIVGLGLNTNGSLEDAPAEVRASATSLRALTARQHDHSELLLALLNQLEGALTQLASSPERLGRQFDHLCLHRGRTLTVRCPVETITGRCESIDIDGALVLATPGGTRRVYSGSLVR